MLRKSIILIIIIFILSLFNTDTQKEDVNGYYGYLVIPKIEMNRGFYNTKNKLNNVDYNIEYIPTNIKDTYLIAGHSGTGKVSFFNNLRYIEKGDIVYLIIEDRKIEYIVENIIKEKKNGTLKISNKSGYLYLTTCDQITKGYQFTVICKENFT